MSDFVTIQGRTAAEARMKAQCTVVRTVKGALNETTGLYPLTLTTIYSGPCRLRFMSPIVREADVQGQALARQEGVLSLPVAGSGGVLPDDVVTVTVNDLDPEQVGTKLVIRGIHEQTFSTARRFPVELQI